MSDRADSRESADNVKISSSPSKGSKSESITADVVGRACPSKPPRPNRRGRPTPEAAADLTRLILDVAHDEFLARGFANCSIEHIAKACRINKHTFYRRFASKDELFLSLFWQHTNNFFSIYAELSIDADDPVSCLNKLIRGTLESYFEPRLAGLLRVLISENVISPAVKVKLFKSREGGLVEHIDRFLVLAQSRGQIVNGSVPLMRDILLNSTIGSMLLPHLVWDEKYRTREERNVMFEYLWMSFLGRFGISPE